MNSLVKALAIVGVSLFLFGCASTPRVEVQQTEVVKVRIPENLLVPCIPERPMPVNQFLALSLTERESYLTLYSVSLLRTIRECDIRFTEIRKLNSQ